MKVGKSLPAPVLFPGYSLDRRIVTHQATRQLVGSVCEALASTLSGGTRTIPTTAADLCPDLVDPHQNLFEVKGGRKDVKLCSFQHQRYAQAIQDGWRVYYVFVWHDTQTLRTKTVREFVSAVVTSVYAVDIYPWPAVEALLDSGERGTWTVREWRREFDPRPQPPMHMLSAPFARRVREGLHGYLRDGGHVPPDSPARHVVGALSLPRVGADASVGQRLTFDGETFFSGALVTTWGVEDPGSPAGAGVRRLLRDGRSPASVPF